MDKRSFLKNLLATGLLALPSFEALGKARARLDDLSPETAARSEPFWKQVRSMYRLKPDYINLEGGYYCIMPEEVLGAYIDHVRELNYQGSWYMRTEQFDNKKAIAAKLPKWRTAARRSW